ncbi:hypothetical protein VN0175_06540 [Helicobacter pylori]
MIKLLLLDVDGTLTDGSLYFDENFHEIKAFNVKDGLGMTLWQKLALADKLQAENKNYSIKVAFKDDLYKVLVQGFQSEEEARDFMKKYNQNAVLTRE